MGQGLQRAREAAKLSRAGQRTISGARAADAGKAFERELDRSHDIYQSCGLARIRKLPVPTVPVGRGLLTRGERQDYDYFGVFGPNAGPGDRQWAWHGLPIAMEAKANSEEHTSMPLVESTRGSDGKTKRSGGGGLSVHQLRSLRIVQRDYGAVSVVVWRNGPKHLVLLPDALEEAARVFEAGERKSIPAAAFTPFEVLAYEFKGFVADWLFPLRLWLEANGRPGAGRSTVRIFDMIDYRLHEANKTVEVNIGGQKHQKTLAVADRGALDQLAADCRTPAEFLDRAAAIKADFGPSAPGAAATPISPG